MLKNVEKYWGMWRNMTKFEEFSTLSAKNKNNNNNNNNNEPSLRTAITYVTRGQKYMKSSFLGFLGD